MRLVEELYVLLKRTETTTSHNQKIWPNTPHFMAYHFRGITSPDPSLTPNLQVQTTYMYQKFYCGFLWDHDIIIEGWCIDLCNESKKKGWLFTPISWHLLTKNSRRWSPLALLRSLICRKSSGEAYMLSTSSKPSSHKSMINTSVTSASLEAWHMKLHISLCEQITNTILLKINSINKPIMIY